MTEISATKVKELRDKTGAGMMDCKKALTECGGDAEKAIESLRKQGILKAEKRSGRTVKEGMVQTCVKDSKAASVVEVLCETDFVAKNETFKNYVTKLAEKVAPLPGNGDLTAKVQEMEKEILTSLIATTGENMQIKRAARWEASGNSVISTYIHMGGRIAVLLEAEASAEASDTALKDICMHIAAFKPVYLRPEEIPQNILDKEREIAASQVEGNKPPEILKKIVDGKVSKWFSDTCLVKQPWLRDDKLSLEKANPKIDLKRFLRWEVGEEL